MSYQMKDPLMKNHLQQIRESTCNINFCLPSAEENVVTLPMILNIAPVTALSTQHTFYRSFDDFFPRRVLSLSVANGRFCSTYHISCKHCPPALCHSAHVWASILFLTIIQGRTRGPISYESH